MTEARFELAMTAEAEVVRPDHAEECLAAHPGEPCPGYPHEGPPEDPSAQRALRRA